MPVPIRPQRQSEPPFQTPIRSFRDEDSDDLSDNSADELSGLMAAVQPPLAAISINTRERISSLSTMSRLTSTGRPILRPVNPVGQGPVILQATLARQLVDFDTQKWSGVK